ncbi:hypothetical protein ASPNIDRAFT_139302, partial [Aspergillus niger ATCC 1015]
LPLVGEATFGSLADQNKPECLEGTQTKILREIQTWIESPDDSQIFWLRGMAGTGKSTISRTLAAACQQGKSLIPNGPPLPVNVCLGASFFFDRTKPGRNSVEKLFPSISNKLAYSFPDSRDKICQAILDNQSIGNQNLHNQWSKLISEPLLTLDKELLLPVTLVLVLDALDESQARTTVSILYDITFYLEHQVKRIVSQATVNYSESLAKSTCWLSQDEERKVVRALADKSDGLFIYAATACRFLDGVDCDFDDLQARMREISGYSSEVDSPQDNLDQMYNQILKYSIMYSSRKIKSEKKDFYELFERMIGAVVVLAEPLTIATLEDLLDFAGKETKTRRLLNSLSSVISCGVSFGSPIQLLHMSFRDFLVGQPNRRCLYDEFCIDPRKAHRALFESCLKLLSSTLKQDICSLEDPSFLAKDIGSSLLDRHVRVSVRYASQYWSHHLQQAGVKLLDNDCVHEFLQKHFLCWLEVMSLLQMIPTAIVNTIQLESYFASLPRDGRAGLQDMVSDMKRFMLASKNEIENAPLQVYRSALIFAPKQSICRKTFQSSIPKIYSRLPKVKEKWDPLL